MVRIIIGQPHIASTIGPFCEEKVSNYLAVEKINLQGKFYISSSTGLMGEYLEVLNSKRDAELISVSYRMVKPECPEFITVYKGIEQGVVLKMSTIQLVFDRAAVIFLNSFVQGLFQR